MLAVELFEELEGPPEPTLIDALRDFLPIAVKHLKLKHLPKIKLLRDVDTEHLASFGKFSNEDRIVHVDVQNRHPNDVLRTLAHELTHYAQGEQDRLDADSWQTGSTIEDEANAEAGVIMREFNKNFPQYMELKPIILPEAWSQKYKRSINCNNPKGFSQRAHCQGRKKNNESADVVEAGKLDENQEKFILYLNDKPVATYPSSREANSQANMVAQKYPTARITVKKEVCTLTPVQLAENLRDWFKKEKWVRMDTKGNIKGPCAREPGEGKPKCLPQAKAHALGKKGRASAAQRKRREDPNPERKGKAINVSTKESQLDEKCWKGYHKEGNKKMFGKTVPNCVKNEEIKINEKQDACYHKVKSRYKVWPSAYASGALVQCRKKGAKNWGNKK